jgi:hypothetical protein
MDHLVEVSAQLIHSLVAHSTVPFGAWRVARGDPPVRRKNSQRALSRWQVAGESLQRRPAGGRVLRLLLWAVAAIFKPKTY